MSASIEITKQQISLWVKKCKRNMILYKHSYHSLSPAARLRLLRKQYRLLALINKAIDGKGRFIGFEKEIVKVQINEIK